VHWNTEETLNPKAELTSDTRSQLVTHSTVDKLRTLSYCKQIYDVKPLDFQSNQKLIIPTLKMQQSSDVPVLYITDRVFACETFYTNPKYEYRYKTLRVYCDRRTQHDYSTALSHDSDSSVMRTNRFAPQISWYPTHTPISAVQVSSDFPSDNDTGACLWTVWVVNLVWGSVPSGVRYLPTKESDGGPALRSEDEPALERMFHLFTTLEDNAGPIGRKGYQVPSEKPSQTHTSNPTTIENPISVNPTATPTSPRFLLDPKRHRIDSRQYDLVPIWRKTDRRDPFICRKSVHKRKQF
jgi:hypothetical protein